MHRANRDGTIAWRSSGQTLTAARLATSTQRQNVDCTEVEAGREEKAAVRAGSRPARRGQPAATFCRRACLPKSESDSKCTEWAPPTVGRSPRGARRIQRAMKAQIAPPKVAVEARPCAWAGRATSGASDRGPRGSPRRPSGANGRSPASGWTRRAVRRRIAWPGGPPGGSRGCDRGRAENPIRRACSATRLLLSMIGKSAFSATLSRSRGGAIFRFSPTWFHQSRLV